MKTIERTHNVETGEIVEIERELTKDEIAKVSELNAEREAKATLAAKAASDKIALLEKLGITADEAKLLLS